MRTVWKILARQRRGDLGEEKISNFKQSVHARAAAVTTTKVRDQRTHYRLLPTGSISLNYLFFSKLITLGHLKIPAVPVHDAI